MPAYKVKATKGMPVQHMWRKVAPGRNSRWNQNSQAMANFRYAPARTAHRPSSSISTRPQPFVSSHQYVKCFESQLAARSVARSRFADA